LIPYPYCNSYLSKYPDSTEALITKVSLFVEKSCFGEFNLIIAGALIDTAESISIRPAPNFSSQPDDPKSTQIEF